MQAEQSQRPPEPLTGVPAAPESPVALERRGRAWLLWSFLLCPCHLPLTLGVVALVFGSSAVGVAVREHTWVAASILTAAWLAGTGYGFRLVRRAERAGGACTVPQGRA